MDLKKVKSRYFLPKPIIMMIAGYLQPEELPNFYSLNSDSLSCVTSFMKKVVEDFELQLLTDKNQKNNEKTKVKKEEDDEDEENDEWKDEDQLQEEINWLHKYVQIVTRQQFYTTNEIKLNPHDGMELKQKPSAHQLTTIFGNKIRQIYQNGRLTAALSLDDELIITSNPMIGEGCLNTSQESESLIIAKNIKQVVVNAVEALYLDTMGQIYSVQIDDQTKNLNIPNKVSIKERSKLISLGNGIGFAVSEHNKIHYWESSDQKRIFQVKGIHNEVTDIKSGQSQTIILLRDGTVYVVDHSRHLEDDQLQAVQIKKLANIAIIQANYTQFFALERKILEPFKQWSTEKVAEWFEEIGLSEYSDHVRNYKVTGEELSEADYQLIEERLSIYIPYQANKFFLERKKVNGDEDKIIGETLWAWGVNNFGQLGLFGNSFSEPKQVPLPKYQKESDHIVKIECNKKNMAIMTQEGELWITGNYQVDKESIKGGAPGKEGKRKESEQEETKGKKQQKKKGGKHQDSDQEDEDHEDTKGHKKQKKGGKHKKSIDDQEDEEDHKGGKNKQKKKGDKKHKHDSQEDEEEQKHGGKTDKKNKQKGKHVQENQESREEHKNLKDKEQSLKHRFIHFGKNVFCQHRRIVDFCITNKLFIAICSYHFSQEIKSKYDKSKGMKFLGGDKVIKKIVYMARADPDKKYTVHYIDRFIGVAEAGVQEFYNDSEIPFHRIQSFYCDGKLIWDRKTKFSIL